MSYVEKNLMPGEELLLRPVYHWIRFAPGALVFLLGLIFAVVVWRVVPPDAEGAIGTHKGLLYAAGFVVLGGLFAMGWRAFADSFDEFAVTSHRVIKKTGVTTRNVRQIPLEKVQDVNVRSTLGGRWLSYGDVELQTAGSDSTVIFPRILHPEEFRNVLFTRTHPGAAATDGLGGPASAAKATRVSVEERLKEAERLYKAGTITEIEYQEKRRALIGEL